MLASNHNKVDVKGETKKAQSQDCKSCLKAVVSIITQLDNCTDNEDHVDGSLDKHKKRCENKISYLFQASSNGDEGEDHKYKENYRKRRPCILSEMD